MTSPRRVARVARQPVDDGRVPVWVRRFSRDDWPDAPSSFDAHMQWRAARREWATAHGFDVAAPYGTRPGADWWAFLKVCETDD